MVIPRSRSRSIVSSSCSRIWRFSTAAGGLDEPVRQGRLAVVDVRDDAEVADAGLGHGGNIRSGGSGRRTGEAGGSRRSAMGVTLSAVRIRLPTRARIRPSVRPSDRPPPVRLTAADAGMLLVCLIWGINFSVTKLAISQIPPLPFTAIRFVLASLLLWLVLAGHGGPGRAARRRRAPAGAPRGCGQHLLPARLHPRPHSDQRDQQLADPGNGPDRGRHRRRAPGPRADHVADVVGHRAGDARRGAGHRRQRRRILHRYHRGGPADGAGSGLLGGLHRRASDAAGGFHVRCGSPPSPRSPGMPGLVLVGLPGLLRLEWSAVPGTAWAALAYATLLSLVSRICSGIGACRRWEEPGRRSTCA